MKGISLKLFLKFCDSSKFWLIRGMLLRLRHSFSAFLFKLRLWVRDESSFLGTKYFLFPTFWILICAVGLAFFLQWLDHIFSIKGSLQVFYTKYDSAYFTLLAGITTIGGVLIGLYYTALTSVASAIYKELPNNIRELLIRERLGSSYMRFMAFLTFFALCLLALRSAGFEPIFIAVPLITVFAGVGVFSFVMLGQRAFYFFDPTRLSRPLIGDLKGIMRRATVYGYRWDDISFQHHYYTKTQNALEALSTLVSIAGAPRLRGNPLYCLSRKILDIGIYYQEVKAQIPSSSRWFKELYEHREWYLVKDTELTIASTTGTMPSPITVKDNNWLEQRLLNMIANCLRLLAEGERTEFIIKYLANILTYIDSLAHHCQIEHAFEVAEKIREFIFMDITRRIENELTVETAEYLQVLAYASVLPLRIMQGYREVIESKNVQEFENLPSRIRWNLSGDIYRHKVDSYLLPLLEELEQQLEFEMSVEMALKTPTWDISQRIIEAELEQLNHNISDIMSSGKTFFRKGQDWFKENNQLWFAAELIRGELEYLTKLKIHMPKISIVREDIANAVTNRGKPEQAVEDNTWLDAINIEEQDLISRIFEISQQVIDTPRPKEIPDYLGLFINRMSKYLFAILANGETEQVKQKFKIFFHICHKKYAKLLECTEYRDLILAVIKAGTPLLDLIQLTGYSKLFSEYHNEPEIWDQVRKIWDDQINVKGEIKSVKGYAYLLNIIEEGPIFHPHHQLHHMWRETVREILAKNTKNDKTRLLKIFAKDRRYPNYDGINIFIEYYLSKLEGGVTIKLSHKQKMFRRDLDACNESYE